MSYSASNQSKIMLIIRSEKCVRAATAAARL